MLKQKVFLLKNSNKKIKSFRNFKSEANLDILYKFSFPFVIQNYQVHLFKSIFTIVYLFT